MPHARQPTANAASQKSMDRSRSGRSDRFHTIGKAASASAMGTARTQAPPEVG